MDFFPPASQKVAHAFVESGFQPHKDDVIHALGVEAAKAATRLGRVKPDISGEIDTAMFNFALRALQEMQIGNVFSLSGLTGTHASESQLREFYSRELDRQPTPLDFHRTVENFIKPSRHPDPNLLDRIEESVFLRVEEVLQPTDNEAFMRVRRAKRFASLRHNGQDHVGTDPIDLHLLQLITCVLDDPCLPKNKKNIQELLVVSALHDVVEDGNTHLEEITKRFGPRISEFVDAMSRVNSQGRKRPDGLYYGILYGQPEFIRRLKGWDRWLNLKKWKVELETSQLSRLYRGEEERARSAYIEETDRFVLTLVGNTELRTMIQQASDELMAV